MNHHLGQAIGLFQQLHLTYGGSQEASQELVEVTLLDHAILKVIGTTP